ncbi:hypothetical protein H5410_025801 [Solanum commersonii]|uniref:Uncharacterized protein n=1 Tax=Solanum commersonii TaxID=4109 RepID=A0A9J5YWW4_SOLCO|nr:hypothetical protein H5410_025801 [Solanum commersonii]
MNQLKKVHVSCEISTYVQTIEIKARNLLEFSLFNSLTPMKVDLCACTKLQVLNLNCANIPQEVLSIKSLSLPLCKGLNKIKIMSLELESLSLIDFDDAFIVTPNLGLFNLLDSFKLFSYFHPRTLLVRVNSDALKYDNFIHVVLDELKDWETGLESGKRSKYNNNMCWHYFLKGFKILESTTRQLSLEFQW